MLLFQRKLRKEVRVGTYIQILVIIKLQVTEETNPSILNPKPKYG